MKTYDYVVIGAGIVGLAAAYKLKKAVPQASICIVEKEPRAGRHQSTHNSGVLHSGVYYKPGSEKALNCIAGYSQMLSFCREYGVKHEICGKVIVATDSEEAARLPGLLERGRANGLAGLKTLTREELNGIEPHIFGVAGIFVPQDGIVDYSGVIVKLCELLQNQGCEIFYNEKVKAISLDQPAIVETTSMSIAAKKVINCAGLHSDRVGLDAHDKIDHRIIPFRGEYYQLKEHARHKVKALVYPVPNPAFPFLGVHFTRMIGGEVEAGPNAVLALKREGYHKTDISFRDSMETLLWPGFTKLALKYWREGCGEVHRSLSKAAFTKALQKLMPSISESDLETGEAGVRAQACDRTGFLIDDFLLRRRGAMVHVYNAPSPAATSSLAIADRIVGLTLAD